MNAGGMNYIYGDYEAALYRYLQAVKIGELVAPEDVGGVYSNIGMLYNEIDILGKAEGYLNLSLVNKKKYKSDSAGFIKTLNVLGIIARKKKDYDKSISLLSRAEKIGISNDLYLDLGDINHNLFETYYRIGAKDKQLYHLKRSVAYYDSAGLGSNFYAEKGELAKYYLENDEIQKAGKILEDIFKVYDELNFETRDKQLLNELYGVYLIQVNQSKKAALYLRRALALKDTIHEKSKLNEASNLELRLNMERKSEIDSLKRVKEVEKKNLEELKKEAEYEAEIASQKLISSLGFGGGAFAILIALLLYRANRNKTKANRIIQKQKSEIETKQIEILDSMQYAKRLQDAIMPDFEQFQKLFKDGFVIYRPKDIVAGDFIFLEEVNDGSSREVFFAVADCTGHGVPGAMLSIVGANGLKRCIREHLLRDPSQILNVLSQIVAENFSTSRETIRDGMDIALCCIKYSSSSIELKYAGAMNPLWIINPNREEWSKDAFPFSNGYGASLNADKRAVGYNEKQTNFTTKTITLNKGEKIYLFSDGYADQFGGEKGKKMKTAVFRRLVCELYAKSMGDQKQALTDHFDNWKGNTDQVDDVCVLGIEV